MLPTSLISSTSDMVANATSLRVLPVTLDRAQAQAWANRLSALGHQPLGAALPEEAGPLLSRLAPDVVLLSAAIPEAELTRLGQAANQIGAMCLLICQAPYPADLTHKAHVADAVCALDCSESDLMVAARLSLLHRTHMSRVKLALQVAELQQALEDRKVIERAKGLIMDRQKLTEEAAMRHLQQMARNTRRKLADTARAVLQFGLEGESDAQTPPTPSGR